MDDGWCFGKWVAVVQSNFDVRLQLYNGCYFLVCNVELFHNTVKMMTNILIRGLG